VDDQTNATPTQQFFTDAAWFEAVRQVRQRTEEIKRLGEEMARLEETLQTQSAALAKQQAHIRAFEQGRFIRAMGQLAKWRAALTRRFRGKRNA
jgi:hypothetical protein